MRTLSDDTGETFADPVLMESCSRKPGDGDTVDSLFFGRDLCGTAAGLVEAGSGDGHVT